MKFLNNPTKKNQKSVQQDCPKKIVLPQGAKLVEDGVKILDLQIIDVKKQADVVHDRYIKRQIYYDKLVEEHNKLLAYKNDKNINNTYPPETLEEDANRKVKVLTQFLDPHEKCLNVEYSKYILLQLVTRLENEIHKTEVQWNEGEHIRKKYRAIKSSLMQDSEKFESTLLKLEVAISEQQAEIKKLQSVHTEAAQMRDATRSILVKQEQTTISSNKARDRQSMEFRRQVEDRKAELERLERKIFSTGTKIIHQESGASTEHRIDEEEAFIRDKKAKKEADFKKLMQATGDLNNLILINSFF